MFPFYRRNNPRPKLSSFYGQSNSAIRLSDMSCSGLEADVNVCISGTWDQKSCSSMKEAGVDCRTYTFD